MVIRNIDVKPFVSRSHRKVVNVYDVDKRRVIETRQEFQVKIDGAFGHMLELDDISVEEWLDFKETTN